MSSTNALVAHLSQIPIFTALQFRIGNITEGTAVLTAPHIPEHGNIFHNFHGGVLMTLADSAAFIAVLSLAGTEAVITTTDMNIRFLAPCHTDAIAEAKVIKFGRTLCPVSVEIHDANGLQVAVAQVTYMRLEKLPRKRPLG